MKAPQRTEILRYLAQGHTLTVLEAINRFGCYALSQRCGELRKMGWPVDSRMITTSTGKRVGEYFYRAPQQQQLEVA